MATRKKASRKKAGSARGRSRGKTVKRSAAKKAGGARSARKRSTRQSQAKKQIARATRVARGVVEQATVAVVTGVDTLRGLGETIVDRVRGDQ